MRAVVALGLVFAVPSQETGLAKLLRNGLFYVEWDAKPRPNQSTVACAGRFRLSLCGIRDGAALLGTKDEVKKGKVFPYSLPSVGPRADPGVQAVSPQVT